MHIGFVALGTLDRVSGGFLYDRQLVAGLRALGATVDVVALPWRSGARALAENLVSLPAALAACDVVIEDELAHPALWLRNGWLRRRGVPVVALVHNLASLQPAARGQPLVRAIERRYLLSVDGAVAVCDSTRRDLEGLRGRALPVVVARAGGDHVGGGVGEAALAARAAASGPLRLLAVAAVAPHKGLHRLLAALARLRPGQVVLDVAGSLAQAPGYVAAIRRSVGTLRLHDHVRLHGELVGDALWARYRDSHLLALPSDREAYPLAALEALGFGLPVLATSAGGAGEPITDGVDGALLAPDHVDGWAAALAALATDWQRLAALGRAALARHRAHGTWADTARAVHDFCAAMVRARG